MADEERTAMRRFFFIGLVRLGGVFVVMAALLAIAGRIDIGSPILGYVLLAVGLGLVVVAPVMLARRWRTPPEQ